MSPDWLAKVKRADEEAAAKALAIEKALQAVYYFAAREMNGNVEHDIPWKTVLRLCQEAGVR